VTPLRCSRRTHTPFRSASRDARWNHPRRGEQSAIRGKGNTAPRWRNDRAESFDRNDTAATNRTTRIRADPLRLLGPVIAQQLFDAREITPLPRLKRHVHVRSIQLTPDPSGLVFRCGAQLFGSLALLGFVDPGLLAC